MILKERQTLLLQSVAVMLALSIIVSVEAEDRHTNKSRIDLQNIFTPSGWMGDGEYGRKYVEFSESDRTNPHTRAASIKITYTFGPTRWGGMYWQNQPDNWGSLPGNNYSGKGFSKVTFWARGEHGGEVLEFKVGGINNQNKQYRDSLVATTGRISLAKDWKLYMIDLSTEDLSSVIGGFCWIAKSDYNRSKQITFFLDDLMME